METQDPNEQFKSVQDDSHLGHFGEIDILVKGSGEVSSIFSYSLCKCCPLLVGKSNMAARTLPVASPLDDSLECNEQFSHL